MNTVCQPITNPSGGNAIYPYCCLLILPQLIAHLNNPMSSRERENSNSLLLFSNCPYFCSLDKNSEYSIEQQPPTFQTLETSSLEKGFLVDQRGYSFGCCLHPMSSPVSGMPLTSASSQTSLLFLLAAFLGVVFWSLMPMVGKAKASHRLSQI